MRSTASLFPAVLAGFVAVLVGYASSAAIICRRLRRLAPVHSKSPDG